jgi:transposase
MKKRIYSAEFKDEAVLLVEEQGVSVSQTASELGIGLSTLQKWVRKHRERKQANGGVFSEAEMVELKRLRKENHRLRMERDILKKATAFFAKESQ